ncbi:MAG: PTS sugar transporter subunit IIB [Holdemania massiliensis]
MIKLCRLDDRMIHGQIVTKWSRVISVDRIIVANDQAGSNPIIAKSLLMAAPGNMKVAVKTVKEAIELLHNPKAAALIFCDCCQSQAFELWDGWGNSSEF